MILYSPSIYRCPAEHLVSIRNCGQKFKKKTKTWPKIIIKETDKMNNKLQKQPSLTLRNEDMNIVLCFDEDTKVWHSIQCSIDSVERE